MLVLMPGVPFSDAVAEWRIPVLRRAFERLAGSVRLIQYDGRGTGHSQRDVSDLSLDAMVRDLEAVVAAAGAGRHALLGYYASCLPAIAAAARSPEAVTQLILFGGAVRGWSPMSGSGTQALLSLIERDWDTFVESVTHAWLGWPDPDEAAQAADWFRAATTPAIARAILQATSAMDVTTDAAKVACPTLVLHRSGAPVITLAMSEELVTTIPKAQLRLLAGSSATLFFEETDTVVDEILAFVTGTAAAGATKPSAGHLTTRELDVLRLVAGGESNAEIAARLKISINTVERHITNLYRKIDARGRADAAAYAIRKGLA
jgi:DNA-binding NarL/FixJ family response regulator